jgi:hypothetical protein
MPPAPPTAQEVEKIALLYHEKEKKVTDALKASKAAKEDLAPIEKQCIDLVAKFGSQHATKSKLLYGLKWEIMATFGKTTSIDAAAVERLRQKLLETQETGLLKRFFEKTVSFALKSTARQEVLQPDVSDEVRSLFAVCEIPKDKTPALEVREQKKNAASA